ncbi:hypothetical protein C6501_01395 [Candidatus Poribacteria bacterium]|nr:MAG: hypothetical protein C6501_01395 [Candidatus Poribacteria bacterium]
MKTFFHLGIVIVLLCQLSCSTDEEQAQLKNPTTVDGIGEFVGAPIVGEVKLESMYEDEVRKLATKTPIEIITAIEGTSKVIVEAEFRRVKNSRYGFPLYECVLTDEAVTAMGGLAQGMSGSPVGTSGRVFGALAYGAEWAEAPYRFLVTPIDAMEATLDHQTFGEFLNPPAAPGAVVNATYTAVKTPITISGIGPDRLQQLSSHLADTRFHNVEFFSAFGGAPGAPPANASPNLSAGDMIGVAIVTGDIVNSMGFGTVTQVYDDKFVAFGHDMFRGGLVSMPVYRAVVDGIVPNTRIAYKSATAYGNPIGTITKDLRPGIVGELGKLPPMIPVTVTYQPVNSPEPIQTHHKVAYGQEFAIPIVVASTLDAIRSEVSAGTIEANVAVSFKETDNVYTESFRTISPDPYKSVLANMGVIVESFTNILANGAGRATIDEIKISLIDIPNILHTEIADVHVIGEVKQGEEATFVVEMLPHWSAAGKNRKMYREVKLQVPENFIPGPASLSIVAVTELKSNPFIDPSAPPPESLDKLIEHLEDRQLDKGVVLVILAAEEDPPLGEIGIGEFFEKFFEVFLPILLESLPFPEDGETPDEESAPEDGEMIEIVDQEELMDDLAPTPRPIPITGTALVVHRFIVTGHTEVEELEVLPAAVEVEPDPEAETDAEVE